MAQRINDLVEIDPLAVPLPSGTEVTTRFDQVAGELRAPKGSVGRVVAQRGEHFEVLIVGLGTFIYTREQLKGNGNFLERVLGPWNVLETPLLHELRDLAARSVSRQIVRHYRGFAQGQLREFEKSQTAKKALYVLRTALTGAVALRTGRIDPDVNHHLGEFGFEDAQELLHIKQTGERAPLPAPIAERWRLRLQDALQVLEDAAAASPLPDEAPTWAEADDWLRQARLRILE